MPPLPRCLAHYGGVREFGCGVTSRHIRRCCRNNPGGLLRKQKACGKCDASQTTDTRPQGDTPLAPLAVCTILSVLETDERNESDESWNTRKSVSLVEPILSLEALWPASLRGTGGLGSKICHRWRSRVLRAQARADGIVCRLDHGALRVAHRTMVQLSFARSFVSSFAQAGP